MGNEFWQYDNGLFFAGPLQQFDLPTTATSEEKQFWSKMHSYNLTNIETHILFKGSHNLNHSNIKNSSFFLQEWGNTSQQVYLLKTHTQEI